MSKIVISGLTKTFSSQVALDGIDLSIEEGEFLGLLGPSGCGKTTTLNIVAGFEPPTAGRVFLDGKDLAGVPANRRGMGVVFQSYALFPHMTVAENVAFGLEMRKVRRAERDRRAGEALDLVRLGHLSERYPRQLSGGQQQRVAIARALAIEPQLLLLDEPLSNLDAKLREEMQIEIRTIQRRVGTTTIMVTHDQAEALATCDRIAVMNAGKIEQFATPQELYDRPHNDFVAAFIGRSSYIIGKLLSSDARSSLIGVEGSQIRLVGPPSDLQVGATVRMCLRPEKVKIVGSGQGQFDGRILSRIFQGNAWLYLVDTPGGQIFACDLNTGAPFGDGEAVGISWRPDHAILVAGIRGRTT